MGMFDVNFDVVVWQNIPVLLRDNVLYGWLRALVAPVKYVYNLFKVNRAANLYKLAHNGQVCYLEAALNDAFDITERRIYITDGQYKEPVYTYRRAEEKPVFLYRRSEAVFKVLYTRAEMAALGVQFIVNVPAVVAGGAGYSEARVRALVDSYRLASKARYSIVVF